MKRARALLVLACVLSGACRQTAAGAAPDCFAAGDDKRLTFEVIQQAPPPHRNQRAYKFYPLTAATTMQLSALAHADQGVAAWYFQWANRSNAPLTNLAGVTVARKLNLQPATHGHRRQRTAFASVARADACTLAQAASLLGQPDRAQAFARDAGITLVSETAQPDTSPAGPQDACVLAAATLPADTAGIVLDFEVQDGRTGAQTVEFLTRYAQLVHAARRRAILMIDPFDAPSQIYTGISAATAHAIVAQFDATTVFLWTRNAEHDLRASYARQMAMIAAGGAVDGKRLLVLFELANTTPADARFVRDAIVKDHLAGVMFWRDRAQQGGACSSDVNTKIATIAFGDPPVRRD
jgi:hypothetical protein